MFNRIVKHFKKKYIYYLDFITFIFATISIALSNMGQNNQTTLIICVITFCLSVFIKNNYSKKQFDILETILNSLNSKIEFNAIANKREHFSEEFVSMLENSKELLISGSSMVRVANNLEFIMEKILEDCEITLVLVQPNTEASALMAKNIANKKVDIYNKQIISSLDTINQFIIDNQCERIKFLTVNCCPPLGFVKTTKPNLFGEDICKIKAEIYSLSDAFPKRMNLVCEKGQLMTYDFFDKQIETLLKKAEPYVQVIASEVIGHSESV